jgi:4a-hydroxytetrahydrobiopterin dehydratase
LLLALQKLDKIIDWQLLASWKFSENAIEKTFEFRTFDEAMQFMADAAKRCTAMNHHPDWRNRYSKIDVRLSTNDSNSLTIKDFELALAMDKLANLI